MKTKLKKILVCILILFTLNNFFMNNIPYININTVYAADMEDTLVNLLGTVVGLLTWPIRIIALGVGLGVNKLMAGVAYIENSGVTIPDDEWYNASLTPYDILFNKIKLLDINFFDIGSLDQNSILYKFRTAISLWYYALRTIASGILLVILIYVGIRMAFSTVSAQQKASYKKMIVDWVVSLSLIFLLQYIMLFTMYVNDAIVESIEAISSTNNTQMSESIDKIGEIALKELNIEAIVATVVYCMLVFQTFALFISYFNRMLKLAFLTIISPLITLTYSIDKMGDGKAQALNNWLKEYVFTILIQPFHAIIYMAFVNVAMELLVGSSGKKAIACSIIAILCVNFIREAEKLIRKIFSFADDNQNTSLEAGMAFAAVAASKAKTVGKSTRKAVNGIKNIGSGTGAGLATAKVEAIALGRILRGNNKDANGNTMSIAEVKSEVRSDIAEKKAEKISQKYGVSKNDRKELEKTIESRAEKLQQSNAGLSKREAMAQARLSVAKERRTAQRKSKIASKTPKTIRKAVGKISAVKQFASESQTLRQLADLRRTTIAAGIGLGLGSGYYGATGKGFESLMTGVATYRGASEFLNNSSKTLKTDVNARLNALGASNINDAMKEVHDILANKDKYEGSDELDKIMKEIEKALSRSGVDSKIKTNIRNSIQEGALKNPSASVSDLVNNALTSHLKPHQITSDITNSTEKLANFTQKKAIYDDIKNAGDIGISPDAFVESTLKSFVPTGATMASVSDVDQEFLKDAKNITSGQEGKEEMFVAPDETKTREFVDDKNEAELEEFYKTCDKEIKKIKKTLNDDSIDENERTKLIAEMNQIEAARAKVQDAALDSAVEDLRKQYQDLLNKEINATQKEAKKILEREAAKLQQQYDKYISEADSHIGRIDMEGLKSEMEIRAQKMSMETEKRDIQALRTRLK